MRCPICRNETTWKDNPTRPFCSERCRLIDLGKWAGGDYRIDSGQETEKIADGELRTASSDLPDEELEEH